MTRGRNVTRWIVPAYAVGTVALFVVCWLPLLYGWVGNPWLAAFLGIVSGASICFALPFVAHRLNDGAWIWEDRWEDEYAKRLGWR